MFKSLFNEFFEPTGEKIKTPLGERLYNMMVKRNGGNPLELERKPYKLKDGMAENCTFVRDDLRNIDKVLGKEKADVISCCHTLYHITTDYENLFERIPKKNAEEILEKLMQKFKDCLNKDGIIVFGEDEGSEIGHSNIVPNVMKRLGFTPLNKTAEHEANVWRKG